MASSSTAILLGPPSVAAMETPVSDDNSVISQIATLNLEEPQMGLTENFSPTFLTSGNPCLDFFFHIVPDTPSDDLIQRLAISWSHDPLTTLKLLCNLRGVRGTGKSDKEGFYTAALWLYKNHPKTLALNIPTLVDFGYFKDLPEILLRILEGQQTERGKTRVWRKRIQRKFKGDSEKKSTISGDMEDRILETAEETGGPVGKVKARALRKQREFEKAKKALDRYNSDANYRLLFDQIADLFAELLKSDLEYLNTDNLNKISLASKWCPSVDSSYDKTTLICEAIARRMFPREEYEEGIEEAHYAYRIRDRLRKEVLVPLHKALELPEVSMSAKEWNLLKYNRVPSIAMQNYSSRFAEHDSERFTEFLEDVKSGKKKMAAGALLPHQIISQLLNDSEGEEVAELQWARMVDDLAKKGKLKNSLAICDVSGSMAGTPMNVCIALGLLVSELNEEPWKGKVITFSENPQLHVVTGSSLREKTKFVREMDFGINTDFQKVFDRILEVAVENNLTDEQMIKRLFVFSDMEFDDARVDSHSEMSDYASNSDSDYESVPESFEKWETDYEVVQRKYKEKGFQNVPEIVFWNLRDSSATPVASKQKGVAMVSGFSKNLLTLFLEEGGIVNPEDVMLLAIKGEEYQKLAVYD
ncbi:von Willebrand factor A-like domain superfamily [Arabidopsis suecica]|uniref:von Willebrand factor A-like domain superfamily n=1 Tax=Arabidopsis suecica TaxID=45249 RepID=A0A8T2DL64_ARASU|nr:von Willebrand factor A-like domain superfamily [Arabidopsis suecica]